MTLRIAALCLALGFGAAGLGVPATSSARAFVDIEVAPPAVREEVVPAPRVGFVWAPGYWNWSGHEHVWVAGRWIKERDGHHWVAEHWEQRGSRWHFEEGHWD